MIPAVLAAALLAAIPIGAVRAVSRLLAEDAKLQRVRVGADPAAAAHVCVWRQRLRWRRENPDTFEEILACSCGRWRQVGES